VLKAGPARKVAIYVGEKHQYHGASAYSAILDYLFYRSVSGASVVRGIAGFGADHHLHSTRILWLAENLPIKIEFVETPEKVEELLPKLYEMAGTGLIEIQDTTVAKAAEVSSKAAPRGERASTNLKKESKAKLMRIYVGENDKWRDKPLYRALVESLRANDIAGVTVYQGILGYGANRRIHKGSALSHDHPIMLAVVDSEEKLRAFLPLLDEMVQQGLVVLSEVDVIKYTHDYTGEERRKEGRS
jgi:PII-like signaling protein